MAWIFLLIAAVFEVVWATLLKLSDAFSKPGYTASTIAGMIVSFYFLAKATKILPIGTAYAVWTGIGAVGAAVVGVLFFKESLTLSRGFFLALLLLGIVGLKATSPH